MGADDVTDPFAATVWTGVEVCGCPVPMTNSWMRPDGSWLVVVLPLDPVEAEAIARQHALRFTEGEFIGWVIGCPACQAVYGVGWSQ